MKLHVLFNKDGHILAAAHLDAASAVRALPVPDEGTGHKTAEVYVPAEYAHYDLAAVCERLKVDSKGKYPVLTARD
jgi:hypothetical protein